MISSAQPALGLNGAPLPDLVAKFGDISGTGEMGARLVSAAATLVGNTTGRPATVLEVERLIFAALDEPVPAILSHPKALLLRRLLHDEAALSDGEVESALWFMRSQVAVKMQGAVGELLALPMLLDLLEQWRSAGVVPAETRLIPGSRIRMRINGRAGWHKGTDGLFVVQTQETLTVHAIIEIKSNRRSRSELLRQMDSHRTRLGLGIRIDDIEWPAERVIVPEGERLYSVLVSPPRRSQPMRLSLSLDVSREQLSASGHALVVWLLEQLGRSLFAEDDDPEDAAINALRQALYYARLRPLEPKALAVADTLYGIHCGPE